MNCGLKIEEEELPANYTNFHEKRIKAVLLFRHLAIQLSSLVFGLRSNWDEEDEEILNFGL